MIEYKTGDILRESTEALVNTVNCVGVMGRGIALQFKKAFPTNFNRYLAACNRKEVMPGKVFTVEVSQLTNPKYIINFPTKRHWRGRSKIEDINSGLEALAEEVKSLGIASVAIPPLGCGLGGLDWDVVKPKIEAAFANMQEVKVVVFEPVGAPEKIQKTKQVPTMTLGRAALISLIDRYLKGLMDPVVTLLEVHKLMYFMQEAGQPLRLNYKKGIYGPYAQNLGHVLNHIEGHYLSGYADGGDAPSKEVELIPGAIEEAMKFLESDSETNSRFDKVADLVDGFETPFGLELLSTVHWVIKHDTTGRSDLAKAIYGWNPHKQQFSERQIELAANTLELKKWI